MDALTEPFESEKRQGSAETQLDLSTLLSGLRAAAEPTRLRLLAVCAKGEWTVTELTSIMGQSQPRISRHLKILAESGLVERLRQGSWVFYRRAQRGEAGRIARSLCRLLPENDLELARDTDRIRRVRAARRAQADAFFASRAANWDDEQAFAIDESEVDRHLIAFCAEERISNLVDIGTGTGRVLRVLAPHIGFGLGIDQSPEMLAVARSNLDRREARNCQVRLGDMYQLPIKDESFSAAVLHQVLHYAEDPQAVLDEAGRILGPQGKLLIVDLAAHQDERMRTERAHRRLGFTEAEMRDSLALAGFGGIVCQRLHGHGHDVLFWKAFRDQAASAPLETASDMALAASDSVNKQGKSAA